jgi:hypothetical protein
MASFFAELERMVSAEVDTVFGEKTKLCPKVRGRYFANVPDGERSARILTGIVDFNPVALIAQDTGKYDGMRPAVAGDKIHVSYDAALFANGLPEDGDEIELLETERNGERLRISRCDPDGLGRVVCVCARAGGEAA